MKYNGMKLKEFTSDKPVVFDPPRRMVVWDENIEAREDLVYAYIPKRFVYKVIGHSCAWQHCAEIPGTEPCWYCNPGISDTTERKNFSYCPICGRTLNKE